MNILFIRSLISFIRKPFIWLGDILMFYFQYNYEHFMICLISIIVNNKFSLTIITSNNTYKMFMFPIKEIDDKRKLTWLV